ncbi:MAG: DUF2752 domain-containing protein [Lachnospiraceae bacterium]
MYNKTEELDKIEHVFYVTGLSLAVFAFAIYTLVRGFGIDLSAFLFPCAFYSMTSLYCPGCGGTRAVESLIHGDFLSSIIYHPIVIYGAVFYLLFMVTHTIELLSRGKLKTGIRYRNIYLWIALGIVIANVIVKNASVLVLHYDILTGTYYTP